MASSGQVLVNADEGFFIVAALALYFYDHLITLGNEVRFVWRRRISGATILFMINRYATLVASLVNIVHLVPRASGYVDSDASNLVAGHDKLCTVSTYFTDSCLVLANVAYTVFAALRMFALYGLEKRIFALVFGFGMISPCLQTYLMTVETLETNLWWNAPITTERPWGRTNCDYGFRNPNLHAFSLAKFIFILRVLGVVFEAILIVLTWHKTRARWNSQQTVMRTPFTTMLFRDGTFYFTIMAATAGLNIFGMLMGNFLGIYNEWFLALAYTGPLVDAMISICMSRFILDLLALTLGDEAAQWNTSRWNTLRFATVAATLAGDLGADPTESANADDDGVGEEGIGAATRDRIHDVEAM